MDRTFFIFASILGALAVALGAFGAHALEGRISADLIDTFETGVRYHMFHTLALFAVAAAISQWPESSLPNLAGWLFLAGILIFSGSLYTLALSGIRWLGAITPIGGVAFIAGWICLAVAAWRN
ncbi:MAG: DUF423 domain-containing protein [Caldilineaceae bacterium]|nr:DUF423 domain-containing protein [Caldilineaceae bacterium]